MGIWGGNQKEFGDHLFHIQVLLSQFSVLQLFVLVGMLHGAVLLFSMT